MAEIYDWSTSAASNNSAPPDGWPEGMAYDTVNNTAREMMAVLARWFRDTNGSLVTGGAAPAYTLSANRGATTLVNGLVFAFRAHAANNKAASTLNVNGIGAVSLVNPDNTTPRIEANGIYRVAYNSSSNSFQLLSVDTPNSGADLFQSMPLPRTLVSTDVDGPILLLTASGAEPTLPSGLVGQGQRIRIINRTSGSIFLTNNSGAFMYRADGGATIGTGSGIDLQGNTPYTIFGIGSGETILTRYIMQ